ncbi:3TM-type holin [Methylobacterium aquaticum]|uniref:3TM-type holin n=1 Tax=Methylobacterium aquaticum TaxID=270351 RepID=UPI0019315825|nr:3TM-type holin [Methylobacterium aquaticum]QRE76475.1 hypothetical protein F1D61_25495 [Methylobacterium aquaticum]
MAAGIIGAITAAPELLKGITDLVERFVPDPAQKAQAALDLQKLVTDREVAAIQAAADVAKAQIGVNTAEAQGNDRFSARWRPACGWVCVAGLAYQFVVGPILTWATGILGVMIGAAIPAAPTLPGEALMTLLFGMLGLGAQRTIERTQGVPGAMPGGVKQ